jgi:Cu(I)/Ag(I) efflux system membrane protein CusA/SilA
MVIYLQDAVKAKRAALGDGFDRDALRAAVVEGALLRLRPKIMTVSTVVAGLLPIMWSQRVGAEVMRPLATPVLGGMLSSLAHVLIVTPLVFFWLHARTLPRPQADPVRRRPATLLVLAALVVIAVASALVMLGRRAPGPAIGETWPIVHTEVSGEVKVSIRSEAGGFQLAATSYAVEFTNTTTGRPIDASAVSLGGTMAMPGMVMTSPGEVKPAGGPGRFIVRMSFDMSGTWQIKIAWRDAQGHQTVTFDGDVQ